MWLLLGALALILGGTCIALAVCRVTARADAQRDAYTAWEIADLPGYVLAKHIRPATLTERQEARRQRLACADCPAGRDPIDVELARMIARGEYP